MTTTGDTDANELLTQTCKAARQLIVPNDFHGDAAALVLRTDLQDGRLANLQVLALALAGGIICKRHAKRYRNAGPTTVWACLPGWQTSGATRIHRWQPRRIGARKTATFLPTDDRNSDADNAGGDGRHGEAQDPD